jgi:hypothetical protein
LDAVDVSEKKWIGLNGFHGFHVFKGCKGQNGSWCLVLIFVFVFHGGGEWTKNGI